MRRFLFNSFALFSLLMIPASVFMWVRSVDWADGVCRGTGYFYLCSGNQELTIGWSFEPRKLNTDETPFMGWVYWNGVIKDIYLTSHGDEVPGADVHLAALGFSFIYATGSQVGGVGAGMELEIPYWFIVAFWTLIPLLWLWRKLRRGRRDTSGLCRRCGYDLRGSAGQCPECGMARAAE